MKTLLRIGFALGLAVLMAEVEKEADRPGADGAEPTVVGELSAEDTYNIPNKNGKLVLRVDNGGAEATNVTIITPGEVGGNPIDDMVVEVGAGKVKLISNLDPAIYTNSKGFVQIKLSKVTSVTLEIVQADS